MTTLGLEHLPGRCPGCAFHIATQGCRCESGEWTTFTAALRQVVVDGKVHQSDVRPLLRGRIQPQRIGRCYSRAKREGLLVEVGREQSDDEVGRNTNKWEPVYELRSAA